MTKKEMFFVLLVGLLFVILMVKYYHPSLFYQTTDIASDKVNTELLYRSYLSQLTNNPNQDTDAIALSVPVLVYHGISDEPYKEDVLLSDFEKQMFTLKNAGYQTITLEDFYEFMQGEKELPEKSFLLTFDDGIKSSYYKII